ncbi:DUF6544 family protein [Actinomycetospora sp. C-140]
MITSRELESLFGAREAVTPRGPGDAGRFRLATLDDQDAPVAQYFARAVAPGAPVVPAVALRMHGRLRLGRVWLPYRAEEYLAPRHGFRWTATVAGILRGQDTAGDGQGAMRWRLVGRGRPLVDDDSADVARSAAGRCGAEAIWAPTAVLPGTGVAWSAVDERDISGRFTIGDTAVDLLYRLDERGHLAAFRTTRWGDPDGSGRWDWHPFGGRVISTRTFGPYTVPAAGAVGWYPDGPDASRREFFRFRLTELLPRTVDG